MKFLLLLLISVSAFAVETDLSGNLEGQFRNVNNNDEAKEAPLFQDWDNENFYMVYGNLNGKVEFESSRFEANVFGRYTQSDLYDPAFHPGRGDFPYLATKIYTFPNQLVARDVFKMQHTKQEGNWQEELVLNKLYYELDFEQNRFMIGRIYINYGLGEIFNPINPYNQPTALTSVSQVAQGNDGASFTFFINDSHNIQFLLLGDKKIEGYEDGKIDRTIWAHGEYQYSDKLQFDYVLGEDQKRQKAGGQISYQFEEAMVFTQAFYQSEYVHDDNGLPSENLWDVLLGYDQQITNKWHIRVEAGYQEKDDFLNAQDFQRFLPTEYFIALANVYDIHPLVKLNLTLIEDVKSGFAYMITKATYNFWESMEVEGFWFQPVSKGDEPDNLAQRLVTTDVGVSLRAFF